MTHIRLAREDELDAVEALVTAAYAHDYGVPTGGESHTPTARERARQFDVWVAVNDAGELIGSVTTRRPGGPSLHEDVSDTEFDLRLVAVSPAARRQGVAAAIMRHVIERATDTGYGAVVWKTAPTMGSARQLYEALGFERDETRRGLWIGGEQVRADLFTYVVPLPTLQSA